MYDKKTLRFIYDEITRLQLENYERNNNKDTLDYFKGKSMAFRQIQKMIDKNMPREDDEHVR